MIVRNASSRCTGDLQPLIDFVASLTVDPKSMLLNILDMEMKGVTAGGLAEMFGRPGGLHFEVTVSPSVGTGFPYLMPNTQVKGRGLVLLNSWEEEFVFVLAHELRHVEQFLDGCFDDENASAMEHDADNVATWVLECYRERFEKSAAA